ALSDALPAGTTFQNASPSQGSATADPQGNLTANFGTIAAGSNATLAIVVAVSASDANGSTLTNTATVTTSTTDTNSGNNSSSSTATVATSADVSVTKGGPIRATAGTNATYILTINNAGPSDAQSVALSDALPANTTFV